MHVFVTGASGFIGSVLIKDLVGAGHTVTGLARSEASAAAVVAAGAKAHRGDLEDLESLRAGAAEADGVIHLGFVHDFSRFLESCEIDRKAIEAMGSVLKGSDRPMLITSGTGMGAPAPGQLATEDHFNPAHPNPRIASELAGEGLLQEGVNVSVVRLPQVHDTHRQGLVTPYLMQAREKGVVAYVGEGLNRWPAAHVEAAVQVYRLALEKALPGARYHAVDEEGVAARDIAEALGRGLKLPVVSKSPEEAAEHFGWMSMFIGLDMPASSVLTQERLGWKPFGPGLIEDLNNMDYTVF